MISLAAAQNGDDDHEADEQEEQEEDDDAEEDDCKNHDLQANPAPPQCRNIFLRFHLPCGSTQKLTLSLCFERDEVACLPRLFFLCNSAFFGLSRLVEATPAVCERAQT